MLNLTRKRKILQRIFGPKRNENSDYGIRLNRELNTLFNEPGIKKIRLHMGKSYEQ